MTEETNTERLVYELERKDFIPLVGMAKYAYRNGFHAAEASIKDSLKFTIRGTGLLMYNTIIGLGLIEGLEQLLR